MEKLEENSEIPITWLEKNCKKLNTEKCHFIVSGTKYRQVWVKIGKDKIWESNNVRFLGVHIDSELKLDEHISRICLKANKKLSTFTKLSRYLHLRKRRTLFGAFIESHFK